MRKRTRTRSAAASWCRSRTASTWSSIPSSWPRPKCAGRSRPGSELRPGAGLGPADRIRLRADRGGADADLRRDGDRQLRPRRVPHALDVLVILFSYVFRLGSAARLAAQRFDALRARRAGLLRVDPPGAPGADAGADLRHFRP